MRWVNLTVIVVFTAAIIIFAFQNLEMVTISYLGVSFSARLVFVVVIVYALGAVTGGSLFATLRRSYEGSRRKP